MAACGSALARDAGQAHQGQRGVLLACVRTGEDVVGGRKSERCQGYNAAISAFGAGGRWELSLQHCRELLATSLHPGLHLRPGL